MAQVVTNENMLEFIQNRQVPEFKAPETSPKGTGSDGSAAGGAVTSGAGTGSSDAQSPSERSSSEAATQPRGADGKFVKTDESQPAKAEGDTKEAAKAADDDDDDGAGLPEALKRKIDRIVAKKHRAMKEAEEFGREEYNARRAAEARAEALQRQIDELKGTKSGTGPASEGDDKEPKPEDFKTVGEYTRALTKWEVAQARKAERAERERSTQQQKISEVQQQFAERVAQAAKEIPDYYEVIEQADWEVPHHIQAYIVGEERGPQVGYYLSKHREEFDRIAKLSPIRAIAELGKLEDKLKAKAAPAPAGEPTALAATVSRAPAPITPLEGKSTTVAKDPSQMTFQELRAHRMAERAAGKIR
jgi:hypothetical protein